MNYMTFQDAGDIELNCERAWILHRHNCTSQQSRNSAVFSEDFNTASDTATKEGRITTGNTAQASCSELGLKLCIIQCKSTTKFMVHQAYMMKDT